MGYAPLEIHHINVGQGDSTLIILRDVEKLRKKIEDAKLPLPSDEVDYLPLSISEQIDLEGTVNAALLIDGGEDIYGVGVSNHLKVYGVSGSDTFEKFIMVGTHYHSDHIDGLMSVYKQKNPHGVWEMVTYPFSAVYDCGKDPKSDPITRTCTQFREDMEGFSVKHGTCYDAMTPGTKIGLGADRDNCPITLTCIASNGVVDNGGTLMTIDRHPKDQNSRSVAFVLQYGDFRYLLAGDLPGSGKPEGGNFDDNEDKRKKTGYSTYADVETTLRTALITNYPKDLERLNSVEGHICIFKANHHGSASSNDIFLLAVMKPCLVMISSGFKQTFHRHPTQEFFNRVDKDFSTRWPLPSRDDLMNGIKAYYITEMAEDGKYGKDKETFVRKFPGGKILGDIIVRPMSVKNKDQPITVQVYGTGLQTEPQKDEPPLPLRLCDSEQRDLYPVGPWLHQCDKH